eukprot:4227545-Pyramimonas_sp.AAC.1
MAPSTIKRTRYDTSRLDHSIIDLGHERKQARPGDEEHIALPEIDQAISAQDSSHGEVNNTDTDHNLTQNLEELLDGEPSGDGQELAAEEQQSLMPPADAE